ncbi:helicase [Sphaerospermopsis aphanizomenoides BCCUSP55]|uniref:helicase-related protein n=1 Tax=Sphaerospermopsis aphanizomenoides TaxID=459663 RepID=UPI00190575AE|nr:helicase-related protein [Sphaerospermopsis aphanizomenoides]MBK1986072.1 helicase [Sphaerospermopsis aphanizomenoides BCCUSP55]
MKSKIAEDLGRLFEVGFNVGVLAYIEEKKIKHKFGNLYRQELQQLKLQKIQQRFVDKVISTVEREMAKKWSIFFIQKGFLSGFNFFREYIKSTGWDKPHKLPNVEILYYQCRFNGDNSIGTYDTKDDFHWFGEVLTQFDNLDNISQYITAYKKKGEFLNADTLILLRNRREYRVICVDLSVFSIITNEDIEDIDYIAIIRRFLMSDISYLRFKSVFSILRIVTESFGLEFSEGLKTYFTAFKYRDKESTKSIQAACYLHSFYEFLQKTTILPDKANVVFNSIGYSDRGISTISIQQENVDILKTCYQIYKHDSSPQEIPQARKQVLNKIKNSAYKSFERGKEFVDSLLEIPADKINILPRHTEKISGFMNSVGEVPSELMNELGLTGTITLRDAHAELIKKALVSQSTYIFLTGNPGIGKTTAIVDFLKTHIDEGFLFFYVSPRKQVNLDIIEKFKDKNTGKLSDDKLLAINTNSNLLTDNPGRYTVQYTSNQRQGKFTKKSVHFLDSRDIEQQKARRADRLQRTKEDVIQDVGQKKQGVLNSICEAISTIVEQKISNNIIATASIQSLKITDAGNTLKHFDQLFNNAYNTTDGIVLHQQMQEISGRIKDLFIMIDEITGDDGGVEFLNGIHQIIEKYQLMDSQHGFNTKVIVADASIVDKNVIIQHLSDTSPEPDKIYFRRAVDTAQPLSVQPLTFKGLESTVINTNSYPASSLSISYQALVESSKFSEKSGLKQQYNLESGLQNEILMDIESLLQRSDVEQVIVYIQNKRKLAELMDKIKRHRGTFEKCIDYLEIHANISENEKKEIKKFQENVKVIFMTASGSRGLSFPKAKHILVEIPKFEIEKNLMEIIQVIYRGRGNENIDNQDKELIFYLAERAVYYQDDAEISLQESALSLLNILLILKAAIMTRIFGYGRIGRDNFILIPIGGKSVFAAGETFSAQMVNLIRQLKTEYQRTKSDVLLKQVYTNLENLLGRADFVIQNATESNYLALQKSFNSKFSEIAHTLDKLLDFGKLESGYMSGALLVVPIANKLEETYQMRLADITTYANEELWKNMQEITRRKSSYPENLRSAIKDVIELVKKLSDGVEKTQRLEQSSQHTDQYYALPLFAFISGAVMKEYFETKPEEPEDQRFKDILSIYIRSLYPVGNVLPIGHNYQEFPFVVFRSYSLEEIRNKIFTEKYLLNSNELNVLNLILSC